LKNISQLGWLFPMYGKIKNVPNHQPESIWVIKRHSQLNRRPFRRGFPYFFPESTIHWTTSSNWCSCLLPGVSWDL
jgi:hypothetical protein